MNSKLDKIMDSYYDTLVKHKALLDVTYNNLVELWGKSKKAKQIQFVEEKNYTNGKPIIFRNDKYYVVGLELSKDEVKIHLVNHVVDFAIADEICWYGNYDLKTLVIDEVAKHLGYLLEPEEENKQKKKKKK